MLMPDSNPSLSQSPRAAINSTPLPKQPSMIDFITAEGRWIENDQIGHGGEFYDSLDLDDFSDLGDLKAEFDADYSGD